MSRTFTDESLLTWEAFTSGGAFGLPERPKIIFLCLSDPHRRSRFVQHDGDTAGAQRDLQQLGPGDLRRLLATSVELD
jgi:hypothetical protein